MNLRHEPVAAGNAAGPAPDPDQAELGDLAFNRLSERILAHSGIVFPPRKRPLIASRLRKRLRALKLDDFDAYLGYLDGPSGDAEVGEMINVVTTNLTSFFREGHHFTDLVKVLAGRMEAPEKARRFRIWSAACSTGEEPYSISIAALRGGIATTGVDLRILATDLDTNALKAARAGIYPLKRIETCPPDTRKQYFETLPGGRIKVNNRVQKLIEFNQLNLHERWPVKGPFDVIFCRNVLIYFGAEAKKQIVERFIALLRPGGTLYLGHSESMLGNHRHLTSKGRTIFRKQP